MLGLGQLSLSLTSRSPPQGGTPAWLEELRAPSGDLPTEALDFLGGNYLTNGEASSLVALISGGSIVEGQGLSVPATSPAAIFPIGSLLARLLAYNWSLRISFLVPTSATSDLRFLDLFDNQNGDGGFTGRILSGGRAEDYNNLLSFERSALSGSSYDRDVPQKISFTAATDRVAVSLNGEAVDVDSSSSYTPVLDSGSIGGGGVLITQYFIRSIAICPPQLDVDLPNW